MQKYFLDILNINSEYGKNKDLLLEKIKQVFTEYYIYEFSNGCLLSTKDLNDKKTSMNKSLMISSHLDTVSYIPSYYDEVEECFVGRGTVDDKATFAVLADMQDVYLSLENTILIAFTFDEEYAMIGAREISEFLVNVNKIPENIILAEPTQLRPSIYIPYSVNGKDKLQESFPLYELLSEMNMNNTMPFIPPSEAPIYKQITGANIVVCGPGETRLCHDYYEKIYAWELCEWGNRLTYIFEHINKL